MQKIMTICLCVCHNSELCSRHIDEILSVRPITESSLRSANKTSCNEKMVKFFFYQGMIHATIVMRYRQTQHQQTRSSSFSRRLPVVWGCLCPQPGQYPVTRGQRARVGFHPSGRLPCPLQLYEQLAVCGEEISLSQALNVSKFISRFMR